MDMIAEILQTDKAAAGKLEKQIWKAANCWSAQ